MLLFFLRLCWVGVRSCLWAFFSHGFIVVAPLVGEFRLEVWGLQWLVLCRHMHLPSPGIELVSPVLAHGFLTTDSPGKSLNLMLKRQLGLHIWSEVSLGVGEHWDQLQCFCWRLAWDIDRVLWMPRHNISSPVQLWECSQCEAISSLCMEGLWGIEKPQEGILAWMGTKRVGASDLSLSLPGVWHVQTDLADWMKRVRGSDDWRVRVGVRAWGRPSVSWWVLHVFGW